MGAFSDLLAAHVPLQDRMTYSRDLLLKVQGNLAGRQSCCRPDLCIFAAGSLARHETGRESDLDLFFISNGGVNSNPVAPMSRLQEIQVFADLIQLNEELKLEPFSGDGEYLKVHDLQKLIDGTGSSEDDSENLFTTRLLLLLESKSLSGHVTYEHAIERVLDMYFRDDRGRKNFRPLFLLNDILRYWRTLCLNYERARKEPGKPWWKRNLNLKFPRKLTVFSTVLAMIASGEQTISSEFKAIAAMTPMERLAFALDRIGNETLSPAFATMLDDYEFFIAAKSHKELDVGDPAQLLEFSERAQRFDDLLHSAFASPSLDARLVRYVLI